MRFVSVLLGLASAATAAMALWLVWVIVAVLPVRDPGHRPLWAIVALAFLAYAGLCAAYLGRRPAGSLRIAVLAASVPAALAGLHGIRAMIAVADSPGHFEGYILLMGIAVLGHAVLAMTHVVGARVLR